MTSILIIAGLAVAAVVAYLLFKRNPVSETRSVAGSEIDTANPDPQQAFSEWDSVLLRALDRIYSGQAATLDMQMTFVHEAPSALAQTGMKGLANAFQKVGTLHSSLAAVDDPNVSIKELGDLVTRDPLLSSRVLKTVNSPLFRTASDVRSVHTAVNILGLNNLKNIIAYGVVPQTLYSQPGHRRMFRAIWQHMNSTAITASFLAKTRQDLDSGSLYTAGLLHDIGKLMLVLLVRNPEPDACYPDTLQTEYEQISATHVQAAKIMAEGGGIPDQLHFLVLSHHLPALLPVSQLDCSAEQAKSLTILFLANQIAKLITHQGTLSDNVDMLDRLDPSYHEILPKKEAREMLLSPGFIRDLVSNVQTVQALLS